MQANAGITYNVHPRADMLFVYSTRATALLAASFVVTEGIDIRAAPGDVMKLYSPLTS